jgi:hypothetical protein
LGDRAVHVRKAGPPHTPHDSQLHDAMHTVMVSPMMQLITRWPIETTWSGEACGSTPLGTDRREPEREGAL